MQNLISHPEPRQAPLRALLEIVDGELKIYPIAHTDEDERRILDGLRFFIEDSGR